MPYRPGLGGLDQVRAGQHVQHAAACLQRGAGERGDRVRVEVGAGVQAGSRNARAASASRWR